MGNTLKKNLGAIFTYKNKHYPIVEWENKIKN